MHILQALVSGILYTPILLDHRQREDQELTYKGEQRDKGSLPSPYIGTSISFCPLFPSSHPYNMSYADLPTEIITQIASHLDVSSAISLAQTSTSSTQAAESRTWRDITIDDLNRFAAPKSPSPSFDEAEAEDEVTGEQYYQPYISLILLRPYRSTLIRSLVVKPQFNPPPELTHLLKLIGGGLHKLNIKYPTGLLTPLKPLNMIAKMIKEIPFPALVEIEVDIGD
jgi:hypothetical protein